MTDRPDASAVLIDGEWRHRYVSANGTRFHVAEAGSGPLVLLLHGFPEFWWTWHHQLLALAGAGFRAVAPDLRGYGASDKPPRGYDGYTLAGDVAGLVRALGERDALLVGHDLGGLAAWATAGLHPKQVRALVILGAAHPNRMRTALANDPRGQLAASRHLLTYQLPRYEHVLTRNDAQAVADLIDRWAGPRWQSSSDFAAHVAACRMAMRIPQAAFCALEYYRWGVRSMLRPSWYRFYARLRPPVAAPTLHLHGAADTCVLPRTALGAGRYVAGRYEWRLLAGTGHFPHLEEPDLVTGEILHWAKHAADPS